MTPLKPLDLLQKKLTVKADYGTPEEGKFANDLKLVKLAGDFKTLTLSS